MIKEFFYSGVDCLLKPVHMGIVPQQSITSLVVAAQWIAVRLQPHLFEPARRQAGFILTSCSTGLIYLCAR